MFIYTHVEQSMTPLSHWSRSVDRPSSSPLGSSTQAFSEAINYSLVSEI